MIRWSLRGGLAVALVILGACHVEILHDLDEDQANEVLHALSVQGIQGEKVRVARGNKALYSVAVPRGATSHAWELLRKRNLPRVRHKGWGEVFGDVGLVPTATQEQALLRYAISGELSRTLESLEGVRAARVHVVLPGKQRLGARGAPGKPRAAVLLKVGETSPISEDSVRSLVAGSVQGLEPEAVAVVIAKSPGGSAQRDPPLATVGPFVVGRTSRVPLLVTMVAAVLALCFAFLFALWALRRYRALRGAAPAVADVADLAAHLGGLGRTNLSAMTGRSGAASPPVSRTSNRAQL